MLRCFKKLINSDLLWEVMGDSQFKIKVHIDMHKSTMESVSDLMWTHMNYS